MVLVLSTLSHHTKSLLSDENFVLGSSGQVGAYLVEYLREKGHEVIEFDKNKDPHCKQDLTMNNNAYLMECMIKQTLCSSLHLMLVDLGI